MVLAWTKRKLSSSALRWLWRVLTGRVVSCFAVLGHTGRMSSGGARSAAKMVNPRTRLCASAGGLQAWSRARQRSKREGAVGEDCARCRAGQISCTDAESSTRWHRGQRVRMWKAQVQQSHSARRKAEFALVSACRPFPAYPTNGSMARASPHPGQSLHRNERLHGRRYRLRKAPPSLPTV